MFLKIFVQYLGRFSNLLSGALHCTMHNLIRLNLCICTPLYLKESQCVF